MKIFGIPGEVRIVRAQQDTEPVELLWPAAVYSALVAEHLKKEGELK
jgi:hypothetical protein